MPLLWVPRARLLHLAAQHPTHPFPACCPSSFWCGPVLNSLQGTLKTTCCLYVKLAAKRWGCWLMGPGFPMQDIVQLVKKI